MTKPAIGSVGTLKELQVEPGDAVECIDQGPAPVSYINGQRYTVGKRDNTGLTIEPWEEYATFRLISRASDTPKDDTFFGLSADKFTDEDLKALGEGVARELARRKPEPVREEVTLYGDFSAKDAEFRQDVKPHKHGLKYAISLTTPLGSDLMTDY